MQIVFFFLTEMHFKLESSLCIVSDWAESSRHLESTQDQLDFGHISDMLETLPCFFVLFLFFKCVKFATEIEIL